MLTLPHLQIENIQSSKMTLTAISLHNFLYFHFIINIIDYALALFVTADSSLHNHHF